MADQSASTRERVALILDSIEYAFGITILILFTVFAWDVSEGWFPKIWDVRIEAAMTVVFFLFIVELGLMIYAVNRWWLDVSFWLCFIATGAMLFELPWATQALFGVKVVAAAGVANLRLHKIFRVMARIGRLLRIIKILLVSRFKMVVSYLFKTKTDSDLDQKVRLAKQRLSVSSKGKIWQSLEALSTFGIMGIFAVMYVLAIFTIGSLSPDRSAERTLGAIVRLNAEQTIRFMPTYLESFPEVLYLQVDGNVFADNSRKIAALRDKEIDKRSLARGELWLDISSFS
ncbi:MAG TPA: hypothetical protein VMX75_04150, partial [Spirochaetia bacterium]|nr:hypothetical protein [Spirochaetia bacterium]